MERTLDSIIRMMADDIEEMLKMLGARDAAIAAADAEFMRDLKIVPDLSVHRSEKM